MIETDSSRNLQHLNLPVSQNEKIGFNIHRIGLITPNDFNPVPGQFLHILCHDDLTLRRPISIHKKDNNKSQIHLLVQKRGKGTQALIEKSPGSSLDIIGPLGNGFHIGEESNAILVAGGIGIAPLVFLAEELKKKGKEVCIFWGLKTENGLSNQLIEKFKQEKIKLFISTEDGSVGEKGQITDILAQNLGKNIPQKDIRFYSCGPNIMMQNVFKQVYPLPCEVLLEETMACGIGACLACTCETKDFDGSIIRRRICRDGPAFDASTLNW